MKAVQGVATVGPASEALATNYRAISPRQSLSRSPPHARQDSDLFDFFRQKTGPSTSMFLPSDFWTKEALQLALSEPAIWHAAAAVGALHRRWNLESEFIDWGVDAQRLTHRAQFHHGKALSLVKDLHSSSKSKFLALAVMLMTSANLMGNMREAQGHNVEALRSACELRDQDEAVPEIESLTGMLSRLDFQAMTFSDSTSPYPYSKVIQLQRPDTNTDALARQNISSYSQAATTLYPMIKRCMMLDELFGRKSDYGDYLQDIGHFTRDLTDWESAMARFEATLAPEARESTPALSFRLWHTMLRLLAKATFLGLENRWDPCLAYFERMVFLAEILAARLCEASKPRLTLEPGLVVPLFFTAHRCRQPMLRRRAVSLLQRLNSQEGMWRSDAAAMVAQAMINVEEGLWTDHELHDPAPHFESLAPSGIHGEVWLQKLLAVTWKSWSTHPLQILETPEYFTPALTEQRVGDVLIVAQFHIRRLKLTFAMASSRPDFGYSGQKMFEFSY